MNLETLNSKQKEAVLHTDGPLLILAGAGSGKTQTMTYRMAYMIEQGVRPYEILAVTFTNKAANEMKERVERLVGAGTSAWIMTFHAMSLRIIRTDADLIGYTRDFTVYDTVDQKTLIKNIVKDFNIDTKMYPEKYLLSTISKQKEEMLDPEAYYNLNCSGMNIRAKTVYKVYREYEDRLKKNNAMDFDDLLLNCYRLLKKNPDVLLKYQNRFRYIMVDEYQDTNHIQYEIIKMLAEGYGNLCVVGDDDQCIYEWRGADISNILSFEEDFKDAKVIKLEQNYRSYQNILECAYSVIKHNRDRKDKKLWTSKEGGDKVLYKKFNSDKDEAYYVASEIELLSGGKNYDRFAILYRTNAQSRLFEDSLRGKGIPYQILSGFSFYDRKETKDMISYLRLVVNPKDDVSFLRVINEPKRGIGPKAIENLRGIAAAHNVSLFEAAADAEVQESFAGKAGTELKKFTDLILACSVNQDTLTVSDIYDALLVKSGYLASLEAEKTLEAQTRIENLLDFKSFIYDYEQEMAKTEEEATLSTFLWKVSTDSAQDSYDKDMGAVTLMTMHSAKGLEFPVVFVPGMEDGLFPGSRAIEEGNMEEERRLCYVAFTRAREKLILSSCAYRMLYGHGEYQRESTFLREIDPKLFDERGDSVYQGTKRNVVGVERGTLDGFSRPVLNPFKIAIQEVKETNDSASLNKGDRVRHSKFGDGTVTAVNSTIVEVNFDMAGLKKLAVGIAPLKRI